MLPPACIQLHGARSVVTLSHCLGSLGMGESACWHWTANEWEGKSGAEIGDALEEIEACFGAAELGGLTWANVVDAALNKMNKGKNTVYCLVHLVRIFPKFLEDYPDVRVRLSGIDCRWSRTVGPQLGGLVIDRHLETCVMSACMHNGGTLMKGVKAGRGTQRTDRYAFGACAQFATITMQQATAAKAMQYHMCTVTEAHSIHRLKLMLNIWHSLALATAILMGTAMGVIGIWCKPS